MLQRCLQGYMLTNVILTKCIHVLLFFIVLIDILNINARQTKENYDDEEYLDLGIRLIGGKRDSLIADLIAGERELINAGHIDGIDLYHFHLRRKRNLRSKRSIDELIEELRRDERIAYLTVGETLEREKRGFRNDDNDQMDILYQLFAEKTEKQEHDYDNIDISKLQMGFNDKLYGKQWYLENKGQLNTPSQNDMNLPSAWLAGYSGKGITICVVDDGLDHTHPDISDHYRPDLSYDLNDLNDSAHDPMPQTFDGSNSHGTHCASAAAAIANNKMCGVGPAYDAYISAIRLLDGIVTTLSEARSLTMFAPDIDILSASWGPSDDGTRMEAPGDLIRSALDYAVTKGRHGKGTLLIWASGNGGKNDDHCGADGYVSHQNVISISTINHLGQSVYFDERCPSTLAVAYTGGQHQRDSGEKGLPIGVVTADVQNKCKTDFFGTSGAAPVAAGILALVLEANPQLTYRDVMHIITQTARIPSLVETDDWIINGAGYHVSHKFGFGVLDAGQMVALAQNWTNVQPRYECYYEHKPFVRQLDIGTVVEISIEVGECANITNLEHVIANISFVFHRRGDVKIILISPSKTPSEMLGYRANDATSKGTKYFAFLSAHHWDESPIGIWTLRIETRKPQNKESKKSAMNYDGESELGHFGLRFYGSNNPNNDNSRRKKRNNHIAFIPNEKELESIYKRELSLYETPHVMQKRDYEILLKKRQHEKQKKNFDFESGGILSFFRRVFSFWN